jgi:hypothetical protein
MNDQPKYDDSSSTDASLRTEALMTTLLTVAILATVYAFLERFVWI